MLYGTSESAYCPAYTVHSWPDALLEEGTWLNDTGSPERWEPSSG